MINKKLILTVGIISIFFISSLLIIPSNVQACSCVKPGTVEESKIKSDAVFEGTATSVKTSSQSLFRSSERAVKASFQVNEVWKGHVAPTLEVKTPESKDSCGYTFKVGERYLVYAKTTGKSLQALCSATLLHSEANQHIKLLGIGSLPPQPDIPVKKTESSFAQGWYIGLGGVAVVSLISVFYRQRKRSKSRT
ncbi:hypothetical protein BK120_20230 [Paenibacillus sp. FSL A5-0031]|uniref:hypothetical protein n=1 Tax=Paenibacillus sp. FSL A5-0031 TaxID=1920420 RepID=UPI00096CC148|nr:hypothetical protein [Paenibacillus sp. FSL A5-0031]OME80161.1 hypothetical protein BK120_20230 [Paenibacillus sp. FSL A5-0031]